MKSKVFSIPLRRSSAAGDYSCADGEIESTEGLEISGSRDISQLPDEPGGGSFAPFSSRKRIALPEPPAVTFSLLRSVLPGWHANPEAFPSMTVDSDGTASEDWGRCALGLLRRLKADACRHGLFVEPFLALAALRLADGSHILPSVPVLLTPNSSVLPVAGESDLSVGSMRMRVMAAVCRLQAGITMPALPEEWAERVTCLDIFVSRPLAQDSPDSVTGFHRLRPSGFTHSSAGSGAEYEHSLSDDAETQIWLPDAVDESLFAKELENTDKFYLISSVDIDGITGDSMIRPVELNCGGLASALSGECYIPDYAHHTGAEGACSSDFSGRTTICDLTMTVARVPLLSSVRQHTSGVRSPERVAMEAEILKGGKRLRSYFSGGETGEIGQGAFPRWLFFPDPDAAKLTIVSESESYVVKLRRHPRLHGAFFWCGGYDRSTLSDMGVETIGASLSADAPPAESRDAYRLPSAVWRSARGERALYPDALLMRLDVGRVIGVCRAFRSSGLVGTTSPTAYAFTSDGIFLLKEMDDGTLRDAGLISAHVLSEPASVAICGRTLEFTDISGERLKIEGTSVKRASDSDAAEASPSGRAVIVCGNAEGSEGSFTTRPVKLGDAESSKRILSVAVRGTADPSKLTITVSGSVDLRRWRDIAKGSRAVSGMWGPSVRFVKVKVSGRLSHSDTIEAIVVRVLV